MSNFLRICLVLLFRLDGLVSAYRESFHNKYLAWDRCLCSDSFGDFRRLKLNALIPEILLTLRLPFDMLEGKRRIDVNWWTHR